MPESTFTACSCLVATLSPDVTNVVCRLEKAGNWVIEVKILDDQQAATTYPVILDVQDLYPKKRRKAGRRLLGAAPSQSTLVPPVPLPAGNSSTGTGNSSTADNSLRREFEVVYGLWAKVDAAQGRGDLDQTIALVSLHMEGTPCSLIL